MMKYVSSTLLAVLGLVVVGACHQKQPSQPAGRQFTDEVRLRMTPVKNQGASSLCWLYAMLATIETEHLMRGDSVNLSPLYNARLFLQEQVEKYYLTQGEKRISLRGVLPMALRSFREHGVHPYDYYYGKGEVDFFVLIRKIKSMADAAIARRSGLNGLRKQVGELLDHEIGYMPRYVHMLGAEYTSLEFGHSVCMPDEYVALTSFTHHPFGQQFALEVPDNQLHDVFLNVSCDTLMLCIERSLRAGHPVCWEGDLSEDGFSFKKGVGELSVPDSQTDAVQKQRQREFERFQTTDDHCMTLVGIAHDQQGKRYYIAKNSWGENNPYKGLVYLSEDYVRIKTIAAVVLREMAEQVLGKTDLELDE